MTILDDNWTRWIPEPNTGCYLWTGAVKGDGGGSPRKIPSMRDPKEGEYAKPRSAVKIICDEIKGSLPRGLTRSHRCDNLMCVNPDHIVYESQYDNMQRTPKHRVSEYVAKRNRTVGENRRRDKANEGSN